MLFRVGLVAMFSLLAVSPAVAGVPGVPLIPPARQVVELTVPAEVAEAVAVNYEIGRNNWDAYGISQVRLYDVSGFSREAALAEIIRQTAGSDDGSLAHYCEFGLADFDEPTTTDAAECAHHLLAKDVRNELLGWIGWVGGDPESTQDAERKTFYTALASIATYVVSIAGSDYVEVVGNQNIWSVDVNTSVLFNADGTRAVLVLYDWGA